MVHLAFAFLGHADSDVYPARGSSGWKSLKGLAYAWKSPTARPIAAKITAAQLGVWALLWVGLGRWWLYPVLWLAPWLLSQLAAGSGSSWPS